MVGDLYKRIGHRIKIARENLNIPQEDLAKRLGYSSPATISHFETGQRKISIVDLQHIAGVLGIPVENFFEEDIPNADKQRFRLRATNIRPSARSSVIDFLAFAHKHAQKPVEIPINLREMRPGIAAEKILEITIIAKPPVNASIVAKRLNLPVFYWEFPDEVSGIFIVEDSTASIGVNVLHPNVRQRFTIAHEIGHFIYHEDSDLFVDFVEMELAPHTYDDKQRELETKANQFAADLLMPKKWLREDFGKHGVEGITLISQLYEVSEQALWFRLLNLKLVE